MRRGGRRGPGPLWWRAPWRLLRQGPWVVLVLVALVLAGAAASAEVLSASAWQRVAVQRVVDGIPPGATARVAPLLRVTGTPGPGPALDALRERVDAVPGLGRGELLGRSFADELDTAAIARRESVVVGPGGEARARLVSVDDVAARTVPAGAADADADAADTAGGGAGETAGLPAVWLPADVATAVGAGTGDRVDVVLRLVNGPRLVDEQRAGAVVAGVVQVQDDGTTPADVEGSTFWGERAVRLPTTPGDVGRSPVVLAEPPAAAALAGRTGDTLLWSIDARLDPLSPTPAQLFDAAGAAQDLQRSLAARPPDPSDDRLTLVTVTGLPQVAQAAQDVALRTVAETRSAAFGLIGLGLGLVLAVAVLDVTRRRQELALLVGLGHRPGGVAALAAVEVLPVAVLAWALQLPLAWLGVVAVTGARPQPEQLGVAVAQSTAVLALGVALHVVVTWAGAALAARRGARQEGADRARAPWRAVLVAATVAAVAGLLAAPVGGSRGLDVLVPVLVAASVGAVGATGLRRALAGTGRRSDRTGASSRAALGRTVLLRRLGADDGRVVVVTALAAAVGLAVHVLVGAALVERAVTDKAAVLAGATTVVRASFAVDLVPDLPAQAPADGTVREVDAPPGATLVFRDTGTLPGQRPVDVAVVAPDELREVALWGSAGGPLRAGRDALAVLADADRAATPDDEPRLPFEVGQEEPMPPVPAGSAPVVVVGDPAGLAVGDRTALETSNGLVGLEVVALVPAFPGLDPDLRTGLVAATASYLPRLPLGDARFASRTPVLDIQAVELWSSRPVGEVASRLVADGVDPALLDDDRRVRSAETVLTRPAFVAAGLASPYLALLAVLLLVAAGVALCLAVDRAVTRSRAGDLVLARAGLGAGGTRALLVVEAAVLVVAGTVLGVLGWAATLPLQQRLLEPEPAVPPLVAPGTVPLVLPDALLLVGAAAALALVAAGAVVRGGTRARGEEEVLRGLR